MQIKHVGKGFLELFISQKTCFPNTNRNDITFVFAHKNATSL